MIAVAPARGCAVAQAPERIAAVMLGLDEAFAPHAGYARAQKPRRVERPKQIAAAALARYSTASWPCRCSGATSPRESTPRLSVVEYGSETVSPVQGGKLIPDAACETGRRPPRPQGSWRQVTSGRLRGPSPRPGR